ncbi:uncharacterized protein LOC107803945 [Nicotiana tabacum]|uniref:Uncharacterized protein LOC107803945 n=1 Tax=Nicotiana tabacum TaxID=4097 RepID=A0A1S4B2Q8_TOBAC|nr:uncharacterized protein LOC104104969 [Nicotiana tomentosiformis]XP_016483225.1 PREDICTED: uncharacterized protein LOC107803945 [Nicotiana tabacum]
MDFISESVALVFDNSLLWNFRYSMFVEMLAIGMGDRAGAFADQVFDGNFQKNNHECIFLFANKESILISLSYHDCRISTETEGLSRNAAFLQSILNLQYGHQFSMYHCRCLDTGQTPSLVTLSGAVQSWLKCLDNEPATVGVFVAALASAVEATQSNLMDQMLDEMPPYCSKLFDLGPSAATVILAAMGIPETT